MKTCNKCNIKKPLNEYYTCKGGDGHQKICKSCWKQRNLENATKGKYWKKLNSKPSSLKAKSKWSNKYQGVYALYDSGVCLYVGESKRINHRIADHFSYTRNLKCIESKKNKLYDFLHQYPNYVAGIIEICDNHKEREKYYINKLKPKYNYGL